jgi:hypothetical protein
MRESIPVRRAAVFALAILLGFAASAWSALTNGDFEAGGASWIITSGPVEFDAGIAIMHENEEYIEGTSLTSFEQTFALAPGDATLSFDYRLSVEGAGEIPETDHFRITLNGTQHDVASSSGLLFSGDSVEGPWSLDVSALPRGDTTLAFLLVGQDDAFTTTVEIDNVACTGSSLPVPAPGVAVLVALGLACMASRRRLS